MMPSGGVIGLYVRTASPDARSAIWEYDRHSASPLQWWLRIEDESAVADGGQA
jgi:hypothetical protein